MTTTIQADGPLYVGPPYATASFNDLFTVLHVLVGAVFVLSGLVAMVAVAVAVFSVHPGCGPSRASVVAPLAMVVSFVTGASTAAWAAVGPDMGLLTLLAATGLVVVVGWCIAWRERLWWADYSAAQSRDGAEGAPQ